MEQVIVLLFMGFIIGSLCGMLVMHVIHKEPRGL